MNINSQQKNYENARPILPKDSHSPVNNLIRNVTASASLDFNEDEQMRHRKITKTGNEHWKKLQNSMRQTTQHRNQSPGLESVSLIDSRVHLAKAKTALQPIISIFEIKHKEVTDCINGLHSAAADKIKNYTTNSAGQEIRTTLRSMSKKDLDKFVNKSPTSVDPAVWASIAESPTASIFLTDAQMNRARSNVIHAIFPEFEVLQQQEKTAANAVKNFNDQINSAHNVIESRINSLRQKHPNSFVGLNTN